MTYARRLACMAYATGGAIGLLRLCYHVETGPSLRMACWRLYRAIGECVP